MDEAPVGWLCWCGRVWNPVVAGCPVCNGRIEAEEAEEGGVVEEDGEPPASPKKPS